MKAYQGKKKGQQQGTPAAELPDAVLTKILQHIPLQQRLATCALVCKAWQAAVASTAADIEYQLSNTTGHCSHMLQHWLQQCGGQVVSMQLTASTDMDYDERVFELPCSMLQQLERMSVARVMLQLHAGQARASTRSSASRASCPSCSSMVNPSYASGRPTAAATSRAGPGGGTDVCLPKLQQLSLTTCWMPVQHFLQFSQLTRLCSMHLHALHFGAPGKGSGHAHKPHAALQAVLQALTQLTGLSLAEVATSSHDGSTRAAHVLAPISTMQQLQRLALDDTACPHFERLMPVLPSSLTALHLDGPDILPAAQDLQAFSRLSSLQDVVLNYVWMDPRVLLFCPAQLRGLTLDDVQFDTAQGDLAIHEDMISTLLSALARLTQLQTLKLTNLQLDLCTGLTQLFSAFTASKQLTALCLQEDLWDLLPKGAWRVMLPASGLQLQQLRVLSLAGGKTAPGNLQGADIARIGSCCPNLVELHLENVVQADTDVSSLLSLHSSMCSLTVRGDGFGDAEIPVVVQLTHLQRLTWKLSSRLTDAGLQQLTVLQQLQTLDVSACYSVALLTASKRAHKSNYKLLSRDGSLLLDSLDKTRRPPVWKQLARLFQTEAACKQRQRSTRAAAKRLG